MTLSLPQGRVRPIWLASYPRSGNTFLRILLQNYFHLPTYSVYRVEGQEFHDPSADALEQAPFLPRDWRERLTTDIDAPPVLIKTHGAPEKFGAALYLVRDGRAAVDSYFHYHKKFSFEQPSLTEVIAGACQFGSWSEHYQSWQPHTRPQTLCLKYEDLVNRPADCVPELARFLQLNPAASRLPTFAELKQRLPDFFRRGQDGGFLREWAPGQLALFNQLHGAVMTELGYGLEQSTESAASTAMELAHSAARSHRVYLEQLAKLGNLSALYEQLQQNLARVTRTSVQLATARDHLSGQLHNLVESRWVKVGVRLGLLPTARRQSSRAVDQAESAGVAA